MTCKATGQGEQAQWTTRGMREVSAHAPTIHLLLPILGRISSRLSGAGNECMGENTKWKRRTEEKRIIRGRRMRGKRKPRICWSGIHTEYTVHPFLHVGGLVLRWGYERGIESCPGPGPCLHQGSDPSFGRRGHCSAVSCKAALRPSLTKESNLFRTKPTFPGLFPPPEFTERACTPKLQISSPSEADDSRRLPATSP